MMLNKIFTKNFYPVIPGPMCGIMDFPFREMILKFGAPMIYTEMLSSDAMRIENRREYIKHASKKSYKNTPFVIQLAGHDEKIMSEAAKVCEDLGADIIDLNFGCPVKKVVNGYAGSALMKDLNKSKEIIKSVVQAVKLPVTIKMRMGWNEECLNAPELAKIAESFGVQAVTIHGRTRSQMYTGKANWKFIKTIKDQVNIPVIANGDIIDYDTLIQAKEESFADGFMISRGMYGKPWLAKKLEEKLNNQNQATSRPKLLYKEIIEPHINLIIQHYGERNGLGFVIKHLFFYSKSIEGSADYRKKIADQKDIDEILKISKDFFEF